MKKVSFKKFLQLASIRRKHMDEASTDVKKYEFLPNQMAGIRHPDVQYVTIQSVETLNDQMKRYTLVPDPERGTTSLAPFKAGQYISVRFEINQIRTTRPYSLCGSSAGNHYEIAIQIVDGGLASQYAHEHWTVGTKLEISGPEGQFVYEPLRDEKRVIGLGGGSGITPFLSMAKSICDGRENFDLTIFYGARTKASAAFADELKAICGKCSRIRMILVLSEEKAEGYEHGFITRELIEKYKDENTSFFLCGPRSMYRALLGTLGEMGADERHVRCEMQGEAVSIRNFEDAPKDLPQTVQITVKMRDQTYVINGRSDMTILRNIENAGIAALSKCRSGSCGFCHSSLQKGTAFVPGQQDHLRMADRIYNQIHICSAFPLSDLVIVVPSM